MRGTPRALGNEGKGSYCWSWGRVKQWLRGRQRTLKGEAEAVRCDERNANTNKHCWKMPTNCNQTDL